MHPFSRFLLLLLIVVPVVLIDGVPDPIVLRCVVRDIGFGGTKIDGSNTNENTAARYSFGDVTKNEGPHHPDFGCQSGAYDHNIVTVDLGSDNKPVYRGSSVSTTNVGLICSLTLTQLLLNTY